MMILIEPVFGMAEPGIAGKQQRQVGWINANRGIGRRAVMNAMMLVHRRYHDHIAGLLVPGPLSHPAGRSEQHSDHELVILGDTLRANGDIEMADAKAEIADSNMRDMAAQFAATELHDVEP